MLRSSHTLPRVILITAAWTLMAGAFANTAAADVGITNEFTVDLTVDTSRGEADAGSATAGCWDGDTAISCTGPFDTWWTGDCYAKVYSDDPSDPNPDAKWWWDRLGETSGVLLYCMYYRSGGTLHLSRSTDDIRPFWVDSATPPSLVDLTNEAYLLVNGAITAPQIGIFPGDLEENNPEAMGLVGVPTWFWSKDAGPGIGFPWTGTAEIPGDTRNKLTVTAELNRTVWDSGDGGQVVCGLGTEAHNIHRPTPSPSRCDHIYMERAKYTVTATTYVNVTWKGAGRSGSFTLSVQRSGVYRVGEIQVVNVTGKG
jgi:hypothetical protein